MFFCKPDERVSWRYIFYTFLKKFTVTIQKKDHVKDLINALLEENVQLVLIEYMVKICYKVMTNFLGLHLDNRINWKDQSDKWYLMVPKWYIMAPEWYIIVPKWYLIVPKWYLIVPKWYINGT
jgi:hypothetical protein